MLIPLAEVLALPSFRAAEPAVLVGDVDDASVRWVHSSEVFEMGALLAGGELLLTTGLGLHGRTSAQLADYVRRLADAGCVALAMELGRSFFAIPAPMVEAAREHGLVLITLTSVVPFERMGEDFHEALLRRKLSEANAEPLWQDFLAEVLAGNGLRALLDAVSRAAGCGVDFQDLEGQLIERSQVRSGSSARHRTAVPVRAGSELLGQLVLQAKGNKRTQSVAERGAVAVALELGRHQGFSTPRNPAQSLLSDLSGARVRSAGDVRQRLEELGWGVTEDRPLLAIAVDLDPRAPLGDELAALTAASAQEYGGAIVGHLGGAALALVRVGASTPRMRRSADAVHLDLSERLGRTPLMAAALPVTDPGGLGEGVQQVRELLRSARGAGVRARLVWPRDLALEQLVGELSPARLSQFVADQLGPLVEQDRRHASELVRTLDVHLRSGGSKQAAADELGIRRQSLYARLERIESVLGVDLADPTHRTGLAVALVAWRVRTGLDP